MLRNFWFFEFEKTQKEAQKLEWNMVLVLWEKFLAQQSDNGSMRCGDSPPEPAQWHWLCPGSPQQSNQAAIRHNLAGELGFWAPSRSWANSSSPTHCWQLASLASGMARWAKDKRMESGWQVWARCVQHGMSSIRLPGLIQVLWAKVSTTVKKWKWLNRFYLGSVKNNASRPSPKEWQENECHRQVHLY